MLPCRSRSRLGSMSTGAAQLGKHPVEIGHDEIEVRFAPMSRRLGVGPDVRPGIYFPGIFWKFRSSSLACSAKSSWIGLGVREIFGNDRNFDHE